MAKSDLFDQSQFQLSFQDLAAVAIELNSATDELAKSINDLDSALRSLNLGIHCWVECHTGLSDDGRLWVYRIGYSKIGGKWGIALGAIEKRASVNVNYEQWLFNEAPRNLRVEAIDSIPKLLSALSYQATAVKEAMKSKLEQARNLASAVATSPKTNQPGMSKGSK